MTYLNHFNLNGVFPEFEKKLEKKEIPVDEPEEKEETDLEENCE